MTIFGRTTAGFMALVLLMTSGAMAAARGQTHDAVGAIIICSGQGALVVAVDAEGQPVGPRHICPDCVSAMLDAPLGAALTFWIAAPIAASTQNAEASLWHKSAAPLGFAARAPPV